MKQAAVVLCTGLSKLRGFVFVLISICVLGFTFIPVYSDSGWIPVVPGVAMREFSLPGPIRAFVTRMDRTKSSLTIESGLPWGTLSGERQTVSEMVALYDQSLSAWGGTWGTSTQVVAAINGSYFDLGTGEPNNGMVVGGWYAKMFSDLGGWSGFAWQSDRSAFVGACVDHNYSTLTITNLINGDQLAIDGINTKVKDDQLVIITPLYDAFSPGQKNGVEILVGLYQPLGLRTSKEPTIGTVLSVHSGQDRIPIPFDAVVLSARGSAANELLDSVKAGDVLAFSLQLIHYEADCRTPSPLDWAGTYTSIGGTLPFLREGKIIPFQDDGASQKHPRTAVCFNDDWIYFVVVDGRNNNYSVGMTIPELASFCKDQLEATWGVNEDGGGSSTLWVDGEVTNQPSGGDERRVANSLMIVAVSPMQRSAALSSGSTVVTRYATNLHLGPGTNYPAITSVAEGIEGLVLPNLAGLNGVFAKGAYWWKVSFAGTEGWVDEDSLAHITDSSSVFSSLTPAFFRWPGP
jgi:hypothetical protein